jgi:hypothetical protein
MPPAEFEPANPASDRPQILTLDRSATGIDVEKKWVLFFKFGKSRTAQRVQRPVTPGE